MAGDVAGEAGGARGGRIGRYRYEGFPLEEKFDWMRTGGGPRAVDPGLDRLTGLADDYATVERALRETLGALGAGWRGAAASAAGTALRAAADRAAEGRRDAASTGAALARYGESFANLRPKIAAPVETGEPHPGPGGGGDELGTATGALSDDRTRLVEHQSRDRAANDALYAHEANTRALLDGFPAASPAPTPSPPAPPPPGARPRPTGNAPGPARRPGPPDDGEAPGVQPFAVQFEDGSAELPDLE